ncbi:MAG: adenylate/guanylate cyclase domain-containing protein, partial [Chloroflexota bacterium]|nr:adenylate/guanylate cyclase domain-containing protein [Chloroflexota bacterium]
MAALPTGTITFLFTDIEGSSSRWEQHREAMRTALARHDAILRQTIEGHGGVVFKTVGDAFCAAFATAPDALEAALAAQRALYAEDWGAVGPLRVRMALHTGTADQRENDYFGPALNRVARLVDAGHGGQILLSLATQALVQDQLPPGMELRDLGIHRLKDLSQPEHIFQAVIPDLPADFAPLHTLDNRPNNLPAQPTPFIGREREVAAVRQRLLHPDIRLITLTGPGGIGKTRLGLRVAAQVLNDFPDGVYFVALAPISDPMLVSVTVAQTLGVKETSGESLLDSLKAYLREKQLLLLLDNFEQVVVAAPLITELLAAAPGLKVLVTSRASLHLQGEREFPVPPLALPDPKHLPTLDTLSQYEAVELFIQRAQAVNPDFQVTNTTAPAVAEICVRLDGLPLAIELAAARSKLLSPQALLQRLQHRLQVLTGGARDLPARQQTLRSTIDWSFSLLEAGEQTLFARLGVFVGGFSVEAAETVCHESGIGDQWSGVRGQESGDEGRSASPSQIPTPDSRLPIPVLDGLQSLLDKSLLHQVPGASGEPRFRMLEIIREYALERLAARGEVEATERTHATYYLTLAEAAAPELQGSRQGAWLEQLEMEHDNLRAALRWSLNRGEVEVGLRLGAALWRLWHMRGYVSEGREWLEKLLPLSEHSRVSPSVRAQALNAAGVLAQQQG